MKYPMFNRHHRVLNLYSRKTLIMIALMLAGFYLMALPWETQAAEPPEILNNSSVHFQPPDTQEDSAPQDRPKGGGARPACVDSSNPLPVCTDLSLMALVPFPQLGQAWGQTIAESPTLWFYNPYAPSAIHSLEFELWDENNHLIAQDSNIPIPSAPGIIRYRIPVSLNSGQTYRWYFLLRFDPNNPSLDEQVSGRIQRITLSAQQMRQLQTASPMQQAQQLAEAGIWYDTLVALAQTYPIHPEIWSNFLQTVGLQSVSAEPLIPCCTSEN